MTPLSHLEDMLSEFRPLFKHNNFNHFQTFVKGLINTPHRGTMTQVYLSTEQSTTYWCLPKFLSRGAWCVDQVTSSLRHQVQTVYPTGVYVYDESHAVSEGFKVGTHFFRNTRYRNATRTNRSFITDTSSVRSVGWRKPPKARVCFR